jgi:hypothetical protein
VLLQRASGAFSSEAAYYADEGAHYVTALMVRDYIAAGFPGNPVTFAERFYVRFPKIAFGEWPPLFHLILGGWLLPTPDGRTSALLLMALIMAASGYILYRCVRRLAGRTSGLLIAAFLILAPASQLATDTIMADNLVMLTELATAAAMARWLRTGANRDAYWIGVFAGLACMTKGNGMASVLAVPLAIALTRRFDLLRKSGIYVAGLIAVLLGFVWEAHSLSVNSRISTFNDFGFAAIHAALLDVFKFLRHSVGWVLCALIVWGVVAAAGQIKRREGEWALYAAMGAMGFSVFGFHLAIPHSVEGRYLLAGLAPFLVFLVPAVRQATTVLPMAWISNHWKVPLALACLLVVFLCSSFFRLQAMPRFGYREAVSWIQDHPLPSRRYLIISDSRGEGGFIAEVAGSTDRSVPGPMVMRSSKLMFESDWSGRHYRLVFDSPEKVLDAIEQMGISYIVMDSTPDLGPEPHWDVARRMLRQFSGRVRLVRQFPAGEAGRERSLDLYQVLHFADPPSRKFGYQLFYTRGGTIRE